MNDDHAKPTQSLVGSSPPRSDGRAKVTGEARYVDDLSVPGMWHGATVRSPHHAARIVSITLDADHDDPDVVLVTAGDLPGPNVVKLIVDDWPVLADESVNHVGEPVALVAAPTRARARRAASAVRVEYEPREGVVSIDDALRGDPRTDGNLNMLAECHINHGNVDLAMTEAAHVIEGVYATGHQEHIYIETQGVIATPTPDGGIDIIGSLQCPFYVHKAITHFLGCADEEVRVRQSVTGGAFGGKEDYPSILAAHATLLAHAAGCPVKIVYDRDEDIIATTKRHPSRVMHRTGVEADGSLHAMEIDVLLDAGAYTTLSPVVLSRAVLHAAGAYACPNVRIRGRALATNTSPNGAFRGFGAPQTIFAVERQMDRIARTLDIDPLTLRERNAYRIGDVTPTGQTLTESVGASCCLEEATRRSDFLRKWEAYEAARAARDPDDPSPWRGIGLSLYWHGSGFTGSGEHMMRAPAAVRLLPSGKVEILTAQTEMGQGTLTVLAQIVADATGLPFDQVMVADSDTAMVPDSGPTVASRTVMVIGGILARAAADLVETLRVDLANRRGLRRDDVRLIDRKSGDLGAFDSVADDYLAAKGNLHVERRFTPPEGETFDDTSYRGTAYSAYGWGCDVVEVRVDPITLAVTAEHATVACDVGRAIHPLLCAGQIEGGTLQAIGFGLLEEMKMDRGRCVNDRMATYLIPTAADAPDMETLLVEDANPRHPFGAKGVGELPMDGGAPATLAAIENAAGIVSSTVPATPERLVDDLEAGETTQALSGGSANSGEEAS